MPLTEPIVVLHPYVCDCGATASNRPAFICLKCKFGLTEVLVNLIAKEPDGATTSELATELRCPFTVVEAELVELTIIGCVTLYPNIARWRLGAFSELLPAV